MAWIIENNQLTNDELINSSVKAFVGSSPFVMWRIEANANASTPYSPLMIGIAILPETTAPKSYYGNDKLPAMYYGDTPIYKAYYGDTQIEN